MSWEKETSSLGGCFREETPQTFGITASVCWGVWGWVLPTPGHHPQPGAQGPLPRGQNTFNPCFWSPALMPLNQLCERRSILLPSSNQVEMLRVEDCTQFAHSCHHGPNVPMSIPVGLLSPRLSVAQPPSPQSTAKTHCSSCLQRRPSQGS